MNKRQKEVLQAQLNSEEEVIAQLKSTYEQALGDCEAKIQELSMRADLEPENIQSIIYQKQYQEAIKAQLEGALANLQSNSYATVSEYLTRSYQEGYLGAMYDMQGQGIPLVMPIDQEAVTRAVMLDTKLSTSLYNRMGEDVKTLKKAVQQEVSRGIAQGMTWSNIASNLARNMKHTPFQKAYSNSIRIARTEGHRIQNNAALDAQKRAKDRGAEVVKQWDSTLDGKTRSEHRELDGQIREVGEMFEVAGYKVEAPGMFGDPSQDCNCRCSLNQMAKWLLDCGIDKMDNFTKETVSFESPEEYEEWKKTYWSDENIAYMNYVTDMEKKYGKNFETVLNSMTDKEYEKYKRLLDDNPMYKLHKAVSNEINHDSEKYFGGIPKNWNKINLKENAAVMVNTKYNAFVDNGYSKNCPNCACAFEFRKRGYDVVAKPYVKGGSHYLNSNPWDAWENVEVNDIQTFSDIVNVISKHDDGARYGICYINKKTGIGHVIVAEKIDGKLNLYDAQRGISIDNLDFTKVDGVKLWRTDGLEPSDRGIASCKNR